MRRVHLTTMVLLVLGPVALAAELTSESAPTTMSAAARRGETALLTRSFNPPVWTLKGYQNVWQQWGDGLKQAPADLNTAVMTRYGLHPAPYPNDNLPMGLRRSLGLLGFGYSTDCLVCHGGSIAGKSYVGLGNASLDIQALFSELAKSDNHSGKTPFVFGNVRGTSEAGAMAVFLLGYRDPDLNMKLKPVDLELHDDLCEDPPAWWLLHKKKTMYHTGGGDTRSVRSLMQFMMSPLNFPDTFHREEATFADVREYLLSLRAPAYPLPIDHTFAAKGAELFSQNCARCHGTYGEHWTYPNKIIPINKIGTDRRRFDGLSEKFGRAFNRSWFAHENEGWLADDYVAKPLVGYQAPPLDGVWATAPYFHNGSVPTVYDVLNSKSRPQRFTRSFRTGLEDYDAVRLGWKVEPVAESPASLLSPFEQRKIYDTSKSGRGNGGHTYGDDLTDEERAAVIEYLKTL